jgi:16S rRNA (uracil1498-N3)-methyltransferase
MASDITAEPSTAVEIRTPKVRIFLDLPLTEGTSLEPTPAQCPYLLTVLRQRAGDRIALFNGVDGEWEGVIQPLERRRCRIDIGAQLREQAEEPGPTLLFAPLKRVPMEFLIEKATELGVARLEPVLTRRSVVDRINRGRTMSIAIEAAEQCGRLTIPEVALPQTLEDRLAERSTDRALFFGDATGAGEPLIDALDEHGPGDLLIGPEGGFDGEELAELRATEGLVAVSLGPRTLRAETAGLMALACWQAMFEGAEDDEGEEDDEG